MNKTRFSSQWIVAQQDSGKTNLLLHMLSKDLQDDCSIVIMDSKGQLTSAIRKLALGDRLIVFDPEEPFAINPFDAPQTDEVVSHLSYMLSGLLDTTISQKQRTFFDSLIPAIMSFPQPTLPLLLDILTRGPQAHDKQISALSHEIQTFFRHEWGTYIETAKEMQWRLKGLFNRGFMRTMFSAPKTRFHIADAINQGKVVVIDNSQKKCTPEGCSFLGRLFVAEIWSAGNQREGLPEEQKKPTYIYIDEAHLVIKRDNKIEAIIAELRSQRIGLIMAHQWLRQIEEPSVRAALDNCAIKMINVPAGDDLEYFSKRLNIPPQRMMELPQGHFATNIRFQGANIMRVPKAHLPFREMTPDEEAALKTKMQEKYGVRSGRTPETQKPRIETGLRDTERAEPAEADRPGIPDPLEPESPTTHNDRQ